MRFFDFFQKVDSSKPCRRFFELNGFFQKVDISKTMSALTICCALLISNAGFSHSKGSLKGVTIRRSEWCWAGHVIRMTSDRLARRALVWRDSLWQKEEVANFPASSRTRRPWRTRWFRWEDELRNFAQHCGYASWQEIAQRRDVPASEWLAACNDFVKFSKQRGLAMVDHFSCAQGAC